MKVARGASSRSRFSVKGKIFNLVWKEPMMSSVITTIALSLLTASPCISQDADAYPFAKWMTELSPQISDKTIFELILPGASKAGMSSISSTSNANDDFNAALRTLNDFESRKEWALRQRLSIYQLLMSGVRFLDLQFEFDGSSTYYAHNGLYGLSLDQVLLYLCFPILESFRKVDC